MLQGRAALLLTHSALLLRTMQRKGHVVVQQVIRPVTQQDILPETGKSRAQCVQGWLNFAM